MRERTFHASLCRYLAFSFESVHNHHGLQMKKRGRKKIAILLSILVVLLVMTVSLVVVYVRLSDLSAHKEDIVNTFKATLNRDVAYESADFSFSFGPVFAFKGIRIREKDGSSSFATLDRLESGWPCCRSCGKRL